jgi:hypothetical protein
MSTDVCNCGCSTMTTITQAEQACGCGCDCCAPGQLSRDEEIEQLRRLRESADERLEELEAN